jgi:hypothetical protein
MNTPAHTPGPWVWIADTVGFHLVTDHSGQLIVLSTNVGASLRDLGELPVLCARIGPPSRLVPITPDHPDALLIKAAPDLLDAAEYVLDMLTRLSLR